MGYYLRIGEPRVEFEEYGHGQLMAYFDIADRSHWNAPMFPYDQLTRNHNHRSPSYSGWNEFASEVGLVDLFFHKETGLIANHPGCALITREIAQRISNARYERQMRSPGVVPGFRPLEPLDAMEDPAMIADIARYDYQLARLIWLEGWMNWALRNCRQPAFCNS